MNYMRIDKCDMLNGDGIRVILWVAGCCHKCKGCHNPETWNCKAGIEFGEDAKENLFKYLNESYISGITFTGGDPLYINNRDIITDLAKEIKEKFPSKTIWLYTGYLFEDIKDLEIINYIDVLVEGPYKEELRSPELPWVGSSNQRVIRFNS